MSFSNYMVACWLLFDQYSRCVFVGVCDRFVEVRPWLRLLTDVTANPSLQLIATCISLLEVCI